MRLGGTFAICAVLLLSACGNGKPTPQIAEGLPKVPGPTSDFDARLKQRFPIGSGESELVAELRAEKFSIKEIRDPSTGYRRTAYYESTSFACKETWTVNWDAEQGQITGIKGISSGTICL
jgi:hypothetical protein